MTISLVQLTDKKETEERGQHTQHEEDELDLIDRPTAAKCKALDYLKDRSDRNERRCL